MKHVLLFLILFVFLVFAQWPSEVIITEIAVHTCCVEDNNGEWFELWNSTDSDIDINGWRIRDNGSNLHVINNGGPLIIPAKGFLVLGREADPAINGGYTCDYKYKAFQLHGTDAIILEKPDGSGGWIEVDRVEWDDHDPAWPNPNNCASLTLINFTYDNNNPASWTTASMRQPTYPGGCSLDMGSPGTLGADQSLPVEISTFEIWPRDNQAVLKWVTESEVNNLGFEIWRSQYPNSDYVKIADYQTVDQLKGHISSNQRHEYRYVDKLVANGLTYWYKLVDVDLNGHRTEHGPLSVTPNPQGTTVKNKGIIPGSFALYPNYPNPFNPSTTLRFDIPSTLRGMIHMVLEIYDPSGSKVRTLYNGVIAPGSYELTWNGKNSAGKQVSSGIYLAVMRTELFTRTVKMMLIR